MKHFLLILMLVAAPALAWAESSGDIVAQSVWARATPPGARTGVVYMTLRNKGGADDSLVGASTLVATKAGLHVDLMANGVMRMRPVKTIDLKPGGEAILKPGGLHIMLTGLKQPLRQGTSFPMTLQFAHAPALTVQVQVAKVGASSMGDAAPMGGMEMGGAKE